MAASGDQSGGALTYLELEDVGPAPRLQFEPSKRINLITGDNGLGKTFILECSWWALTGQWVGLPAYPRADAERPRITFQMEGSRKISSQYDFSSQSWLTGPSKKASRPTIPGLLLYARVDGSFAVWDPAKRALPFVKSILVDTPADAQVFSQEEVWEGKRDEANRSKPVINGLIHDWVTWQYNPQRFPFETFKRVLSALSENQDLPLKPGEPVRLPFDTREIPTLEMPYGTVPIVHAAAGMRRILSLAYLIVWAWHEHKTQSELARQEPQHHMMILVDEIESHLHPRWQQLILPALAEVYRELSADLDVQYLIATHSPIVMASVEPIYQEETDKLFQLDLTHNNRVELKEQEFVRYGGVDIWLNDVFKVGSRNLEAEKMIEQAKQLQLAEQPDPKQVQEVSDQLRKMLGANDEFWPRWTYFASQHGVET